MSINRTVLSGNLTRDPELRSTQSGMAVLNFGMAVNDRVRNGSTGEWEDYANFINCVMFGNRAESMSRFLSKGMKVFVEGRLRYSSWEQDGQKRSKIEVIVDNIDLPPRNAQQGTQRQVVQQQSHSFANQYNQQPQYNGGVQHAVPQDGYQPVTIQPQMDVYDEDMPF